MDDVSKLTTEQLVDVLLTQTTLIIQMHNEGATKAKFLQCTALIEKVQEEIKARKKVKSK